MNKIIFPRLKAFKKLAQDRGFELELAPIKMTQYNVIVKDPNSGIAKLAYVNRIRKGKNIRYVLDTDWSGREGRLRISVGKHRTKITGTLLQFMMQTPNDHRVREADAIITGKKMLQGRSEMGWVLEAGEMNIEEQDVANTLTTEEQIQEVVQDGQNTVGIEEPEQSEVEPVPDEAPVVDGAGSGDIYKSYTWS